MPDIIEPDAAAQPVVEQTREWKILHFSAPEIQSRMNLLQPDALDLEYTRMMMAFLMFDPAPARIAMIGLGGGSMAKFCHRHLPGTALEVVEINPAVIALRDAFHVPPDDDRLRVIEDDGARYVQSDAEPPSVLLVDGFDRDGVPEQLCSQQFYDDCHDFLADDGILVVNLHANDANHSLYLDRIRESFGSAMFDALDDDLTNSIVFACKGSRFDDLDNLVLKRPESLSKDAWRQLMPTFRVIAATLTLR